MRLPLAIVTRAKWRPRVADRGGRTVGEGSLTARVQHRLTTAARPHAGRPVVPRVCHGCGSRRARWNFRRRSSAESDLGVNKFNVGLYVAHRFGTKTPLV